jgi:MFS family permease
MAEGVVVEPGGLKPPSTIKEFAAALIAGLVILGGAQVTTILLKGTDETVRSGIVGLIFTAIAPIYAFANRALNGFKSPRLEMPELLPWYVTGLFAGGALFAWIQFVGFACGAGIAVAVAQQGLVISQQMMSVVVGMVVMPMLAPAAFLAGIVLNRATRSWVVPAVFLGAVLCALFSFFTTWTVNHAAFQALVVDPIAKDPSASWGLFAASIIAFVFGLLGVGWSALRRERSIGRIAHAARRLKKDERDQVLADINAALEAAE